MCLRKNQPKPLIKMLLKTLPRDAVVATGAYEYLQKCLNTNTLLVVRDISFTEDGSEVFSVVVPGEKPDDIITIFVWHRAVEYELYVGGMIL